MVLGAPPNVPRSTHGWRRRPQTILAVALAALCATGGPTLAGDRGGWRGSNTVKAGYLSKFPPFAAWPETAFEGASSPFRLCVAGVDPFGPVLDRATRGRRVGEHPVVVVRLPTVAKGADCHMLFVSASRAQTPRQMLAAVAGRPVLTVADDRLDAPEAMIQFVIAEGRVRFIIRAEAAQAEGLALSSKLLALSTPQRSGR